MLLELMKQPLTASQLIFNVNNFKKLAFLFSILISLFQYFHICGIMMIIIIHKLRSKNNRCNFISIKLIESQFP